MYSAAYAFFFLLAGTFIIVLAMGEVSAIKTIFTILLGNALQNAFALATWNNDPWHWFLLVDAASAAVVLHRPENLLQMVIGRLFVFKVAMHLFYGIATIYGAPDAATYWWLMTATGFSQLLLILGWTLRSRRLVPV